MPNGRLISITSQTTTAFQTTLTLTLRRKQLDGPTVFFKHANDHACTIISSDLSGFYRS